jgi:2-hydroxychromene-2-carboxylate isomerase
MSVVDYYISLNSPWAYLGAARFMDMTKRAGVGVRVKPARFGQVFEKTGGLPLPKRSPERRAYRMMELKRWAAHLAVPMVFEPKSFPVDEGHAVRLVIAAAEQGQDALRLSMEIGRSLWELDQNTAEVSVLDAAAKRAGIDAPLLRSKAPADQALDDIWDANTADALSRGVFGAPSYVFADGEIFWGQDRLMFVEQKLTARPKS